MPPKKVVVTETLTAELVTPYEPRASKAHHHNAVADAISLTNAQVLGAAPAMAMGAGMLGVFSSAAQAAHGATIAQSSATTLLEASTASGVAAVYGVIAATTAGSVLAATRRGRGS